MATTTNYGWTTPDNTDLVKDGALAIRTLGSAIDTSMNTALGTKKAGLVLLNTTSLSAVAAQNFNDIFNSTYDNYKIVISNMTSTTSAQVTMRLRKAGTDNTSNIYIRQYVDANSTTLAGARSTATSWLVMIPSTTTENGFAEITLFNPNDASTVTGMIGGFPYNGAATLVQQTHYAVHNLASSADFDGFSLTAASGTISGTVRVYGYND